MAVTLFFDGDKRRIYEVPELSDFTLDINGYRIYVPTDTPSAEVQSFVSTTYLWKSFVDFHFANEWSTIAFSKAGGAFRELDENGFEVYAAFDIRLINLWQFVPADYNHTIVIKGNAFEEATLKEFFDVVRLTANVSPRINYADSLQTIIVSDTKISDSLAYNDILVYDEVNGFAGTGHPFGTTAKPSNNITDGLSIIQEFSLSRIHTKSDVNLDRDLDGFVVISIGFNKTFFPNGFRANNFKFLDINFSGDFNNSNIQMTNGSVLEALNVYGKMQNAWHVGRILISANQDLQRDECKSGVSGFDSPIMDLHLGEDVELSDRGFSGGLTYINCDTVNTKVTASFQDGGKPHLEPSCTSGVLSIRGQGALDDRSDGATVDTSAWIEASSVQEIKDILEGDMIPTPTEWRILQKTTKAILVHKNANEVNGLTQLIEP